MKKQLLYINVPWMKRYEGAVEGEDEPKGKFRYTREHPMNDHCQFNFRIVAGKVYGHVPGSTNPDLRKLGGSRSDSSIDGVLVVWIATDPDSGGRVIMGWYKNAIVWKERQNPNGDLAPQRTIQESGDCCQFSVEASADDAKCLLPGRRPPLKTEKGRPGQNPFWYGSQTADAQVLRLIAHTIEGVPQQTSAVKSPRGGWIQDPAERLKVEANAMDVVEQYFSENGYEIKRQEHENLGYDMLATSKAAKLQLEVKGNKGKKVCVELTPNEFSCAKKNHNIFRLCVVLDALNVTLSERKLRIFRPVAKGTKWEDEGGIHIRTVEKTGAVVRE